MEEVKSLTDTGILIFFPSMIFFMLRPIFPALADSRLAKTIMESAVSYKKEWRRETKCSQKSSIDPRTDRTVPEFSNLHRPFARPIHAFGWPFGSLYERRWIATWFYWTTKSADGMCCVMAKMRSQSVNPDFGKNEAITSLFILLVSV